MHKMLYFVVILMLTMICDCEADLSWKYDHSAYLDANEVFKLYWSLKDDEKSIHCAMQVNTTGWVGFGISKGLSGVMHQSDIVIGWVDNNGLPHLKDTFAVDHSLFKYEESQDYDLVGGSEQNGVTTIEFKRKLATCDKYDRDINTLTVRVIYAYGTSDSVSYHGTKRGSRSLNLLNYVKNSAPASNASYFDIVSKNVNVPAVKTTYWCEAFKLSNIVTLTGIRHIVEIEPLIEKKDPGVVHHMVLFACNDAFNESHLQFKGPCYQSNNPQTIKDCVGWSVIYAWAVGGGTFKYPSHVGLPIGASYSFKYVLLEVHFDNPAESNNHFITSGLRFYYDLPRKYESAMLVTGTVSNENLLIPPKQRNWIVKGYCSSSCSSAIEEKGFKQFNGNEVRFFASMPHEHTAGSGLWTRIIRNGIEVVEIIKDENFDFNFQQVHILNKEIPFRSGDEMITYCRYNTMKRNYATIGGTSTGDEMCLNFMMYYPRVNWTTCATMNRRVAKDFSSNYAKQIGFEMNDHQNSSIFNWTGIVWNDTMVHQLRKVYDSQKPKSLFELCIGERAKFHSAGWVNEPVVNKTFSVPKSICVEEISSGFKNVASIFVCYAMILITMIMLDN